MRPRTACCSPGPSSRADEFRRVEPSTQQDPDRAKVSNMRKVVVYELLSLDGVAEKPDGFFADWDDAMDANLGAVIATQDAVILGRRSYEEWAGFWPGSDIEPFATFINGVAKYVATSTPLDRKWANATCGRRRTGRVRAGSEEPARRRHRRAREHLGRPGTACRGRRRRAQAGDRTGDRGQRAQAPRRLAGDSARVDPKHDLTDWAICSSTTASWLRRAGSKGRHVLGTR